MQSRLLRETTAVTYSACPHLYAMEERFSGWNAELLGLLCALPQNGPCPSSSSVKTLPTNSQFTLQGAIKKRLLFHEAFPGLSTSLTLCPHLFCDTSRLVYMCVYFLGTHAGSMTQQLCIFANTRHPESYRKTSNTVC